MHRLNLSGASGADICIEVPDFPDKFNYYRKPSAKLDRFDEGTAKLLKKDTVYLLSKDVYQEIVTPLYIEIFGALKGERRLPPLALPGNAGFELNLMLENDIPFPELRKLWLWSCPSNDIETFLYTHEGTIYLEVFPTYPWIFQDPQEGEEWVSFSQFMQSYKPYALLTIPHDVARQWCDRLACHVNELNICHSPLEE